MKASFRLSAALVGIAFSALLHGQQAFAQDFNEYFDAISTLPNGKVYAFSGDQYARWSDANAEILDQGYAKPIRGFWGDIPDSFNRGVDAITALPDGKVYLFSGNQYVRYSDKNAEIVDQGYPRTLRYRVDAAAVLPNGKIYLFFGDQYARWSDASAETLDEGYPKPIKGYWGNLPESFNSGIDAAAVLPNGKIYLFRGHEYVRYSDENAEIVDQGYPKPIKGNWSDDLAANR